MPRYCGIPRDEHREWLFNEAREQYRRVFARIPSNDFDDLIGQASQFVCCDLPINRDRTDVFRRAALFGHAWAWSVKREGLPASMSKMMELIAAFLAREGAYVSPGVSAKNAIKAVEGKISDLKNKNESEQQTWWAFCKKLFDLLAEECSRYWVASGMCLRYPPHPGLDDLPPVQ